MYLNAFQSHFELLEQTNLAIAAMDWVHHLPPIVNVVRSHGWLVFKPVELSVAIDKSINKNKKSNITIAQQHSS